MYSAKAVVHILDLESTNLKDFRLFSLTHDETEYLKKLLDTITLFEADAVALACRDAIAKKITGYPNMLVESITVEEKQEAWTNGEATVEKVEKLCGFPAI